MKQRSMSTDGGDAVKRCFEAYGADTAKWPAEMRAQYGALASSDEMAPFREEAEMLDGFLAAAPAPRMRHDLKNVIAAQYAPPPQTFSFGGFFKGLLSGERLLPAGAFASIAALGLATGFLTANARVAQTAPEYEAYAYLEYSTGALLNEEEISQWDAD
jgi:hypothetical protein